MMFSLAIDLSNTSWIDIGAVGLTSLVIFVIIGPKLWSELGPNAGPKP